MNIVFNPKEKAAMHDGRVMAELRKSLISGRTIFDLVEQMIIEDYDEKSLKIYQESFNHINSHDCRYPL